jgi:hypothetical protein
MERNIIRRKVELENASKRSKLRKEREKFTDSLPIERNVILFKKKWNDYHYPSIEVLDKDGNVTTVSKRKPAKRKNIHRNGKNLISRLKFAKTLKEKAIEEQKEIVKTQKTEE